MSYRGNKALDSSFDVRLLQSVAYLVVGILALLAVFPFLVLLINSFSSEHAIITAGYSFWPSEFSTSAYSMIFNNPAKILRTWGVTLLVTGIGTTASLILSAMAAWALSRPSLRGRNAMAFFLYFTQLFSGGLVPYYLLVTRTLHLGNSLLVLILVPLFSVMNILIMRNYLTHSLPAGIIEAARIDGLGEFGIFFRMVLPLSKPMLASIGLFTVLAYWNDWWTPMMFVQKEELYPLQYTLYQMLSSVNFSAKMVDNIPTLSLPKETLKLAMTVVATAPVVMVYPFVQKHFVAGITLGAVKG